MSGLSAAASNSGWKNSVLLGRAFHELPPLNNYLYISFLFSSIYSALTIDIFVIILGYGFPHGEVKEPSIRAAQKA